MEIELDKNIETHKYDIASQLEMIREIHLDLFRHKS